MKKVVKGAVSPNVMKDKIVEIDDITYGISNKQKTRRKDEEKKTIFRTVM